MIKKDRWAEYTPTQERLVEQWAIYAAFAAAKDTDRLSSDKLQAEEDAQKLAEIIAQIMC